MHPARAAPPISVVVPCFNEPAPILRDSLESLAGQTFAEFECVIVDESSNTDTIVAVEDFCRKDSRFRRIRPDRRLGLAASLNLGIAETRGPLIARFDSDDLCMPDRLERQRAFLGHHPEIGVVGAQLELIDLEGRTIAIRRYPLAHAAIERRFQFTNAMAHPAVMFRRSLVEAFGAYDPTFPLCEDLDLWLRFLNRGVRFANLDAVLVRYRQRALVRGHDNWRHNLRARRNNFSLQCLPFRIAGLVGMAAWSAAPPWLRRDLFARLLLRQATDR